MRKEYIVRIRGLSPYVPHRFGVSAQVQIEDIYREGSRRGTRKNRPEFTPEQEAEAGVYRLPGGGYGIPALAFRRAIVDAAPLRGYVKKRLAGAVDVIGEELDEETKMPLVRLESPREPVTFASRVVVMGRAALRYRKCFTEWGATFRVQVDPEVLDKKGLVELLEAAGNNIGVGDGRPGSPNSPGVGWGRFAVVEVREA